MADFRLDGSLSRMDGHIEATDISKSNATNLAALAIVTVGVVVALVGYSFGRFQGMLNNMQH